MTEQLNSSGTPVPTLETSFLDAPKSEQDMISYMKELHNTPLTQDDIKSIVDGVRKIDPSLKVTIKSENNESFKTLEGNYKEVTDDSPKWRDMITNTKKATPTNIVETKKIMDNFREKTANYPKYMSYEGSMVLCVLLSLHDVATASILNLPQVDQDLIKTLLPVSYLRDTSIFTLEFDHNKDFYLTFQAPKGEVGKESTRLNMFNSVAHPRPDDLGTSDVPVEKDGDKIAVGGKILLDRKNIQKLGGILDKERKSFDSDEELPKRQPVAGRNAYEIRADVLQMALDFVGMGSAVDVLTAEKVTETAWKFYAFVENRRH